MVAKIFSFLASVTLASAFCVSPEVKRIRNPTHEVVYSPPYAPLPSENAPRLFIFGDVHGMRAELEAVLEKGKFSTERGDRVIFAGDMINKGYDSAGVIQIGIDLNATGVRGNHEDRVLRSWAGAEIARTRAEASGRDVDEAIREYEESLTEDLMNALNTARTLTPEQRAFSANLPLTIRLGDIPGFGETAVVHGGMAPGLPIEDQESWPMYNVRSVLHLNDDGELATEEDAAAFRSSIVLRLQETTPGREITEELIASVSKKTLDIFRSTGIVPINSNSGQWWVEVWNEIESAKEEDESLSLIYGHDSNRGIRIHDYSYGLDSKCVDGFQLTALVMEPQETSCGVTIMYDLVSVDCPVA